MARDLDRIEADTIWDAVRVLDEWAAEQRPNEPGVFAAREAAHQMRALLVMRAYDGTHARGGVERE